MNWLALVEPLAVGLTGGVAAALLTQVLARLTFHNRPMKCDARWPDPKLLQTHNGEPLLHHCGFSAAHGGHLHVCTCGASRLVNEAMRQHSQEGAP